MLKINGQVTVTKDDTKRILAGFQSLDGTVLTIGVHSDAPPYELESQPPVAEVAARNEFGHSTDGPQVPARPFMRPAIEKEQDAVANGIVLGISNFVLRNVPLSQGFADAAMKMVNAIQHNILSNTPPPLSGTYEPPSGYLGFKKIMGYPSRTLVATYHMFRSIGYKVLDARGGVTKHGQGSNNGGQA